MVKQTPQQKDLPFAKKPVPVLVIHNKNLFRWLLSGFMICACMFVLGVLVGRNTAPVQFDVDKIEEKLANLQVSILKEKNTKTAAPGEPDILMAKHHDIIDTLKDTGNAPEVYEQYIPPVLTPKYPKTPPTGKKPEAAATGAKPTLQPDLKPELKPDLKPQPEPEPTPQPEKQTIPFGPTPEPALATEKETAVEAEKKISIPPPLKQAIPETGFAIQVASLKNLEKARSLTDKFKIKGYPAFCHSLTIDGEIWHRVRIGPYPDRSLAEKDRDRLKDAGVDSIVLTLGK